MTASEAMNPAAVAHQPFFITAPGQTDTLLIIMGVFVVLFVVMIGLVYFRLHALPEQMAHGGKKIQFEIVAVLALLALFTHNHAFWIAGLLLALVQFPDFLTPIQEMARSLQTLSGRPQTETRMQRHDAGHSTVGHEVSSVGSAPAVTTDEDAHSPATENAKRTKRS
jgi:hypothetical protein